MKFKKIYAKYERLSSPQDVVDADDALLFRVLGVAYEGGAGLHPAVPSLLVHHPVVVAHHLSLVED